MGLEFVIIKEGDREGPSKLKKVVIVEVLKEKLGIKAMGPSQEDIIYKPEPKSGK
jgi:hypothetical protein